MNARDTRPAASGRARGAIVEALIALAWAFYGSSILRGPGYAFLGASVLLTAGLVIAGVGRLRQARRMSPATPDQIAAGRRTWRWFWVNLAAEIVLLNIAVNLLGIDGRSYLIPAISSVVGAHFMPMAVFFPARGYWSVAIAMLTAAAMAALCIYRHVFPAIDVAYVEALANAAILWSSAGGLIFTMPWDRRTASSESG